MKHLLYIVILLAKVLKSM